MKGPLFAKIIALASSTSLFAAYLADVHRALISEVPFDVERVCGFLKEDRANSPSNLGCCSKASIFLFRA